MKKLYTLLALMLCAITAVNAQNNLNLDEWIDEETAIEWDAQLNALSFILGGTSVVRTEGAVGSTFAAKLQPVDLSLFAPGLYASLFAYGEGGTGIAYNDLLDSAYFYYEHAGEGIFGNVTLTLTSYDETTQTSNPIATANFDSQTATNGFVEAAVVFEYDPAFEGFMPDSLTIEAIAVGQDSSVVGTTHFTVDEFRLVKKISDSIKKLSAPKVEVYPTIAATQLTFAFVNEFNGKLIVSDITGKKIISEQVNGSKRTIDVSNLSNGTYLYSVTNLDGESTAGKFIVQH